MGSDKFECTWKKFGLLTAFAGFLFLSGLCVRCAENEQVGYTNDTSMWIFGISAIFAYFAILVLFFLLKRRSKNRP